MTPFNLVTARLERVSKPRTTRDGTTIRAQCPACGGTNRSKLVVTEKLGGSVLVHCFAGCGAAEVVDALGLELSDLFLPDSKRSSKGYAEHKRHDSHTLCGIAIEIINEVEFLLLRQAAEPVEGIAGVLIERAAELAGIREFLRKEVQHD